jgi:hypothetical protein
MQKTIHLPIVMRNKLFEIYLIERDMNDISAKDTYKNE